MDKLCRLCRSDHSFIKTLHNLSCYDKKELLKKVKSCLTFEFDLHPQLPSTICGTCLDKVEMFHEFQQKCFLTEVSLRKKNGCDEVLKIEYVKKNFIKKVTFLENTVSCLNECITSQRQANVNQSERIIELSEENNALKESIVHHSKALPDITLKMENLISQMEIRFLTPPGTQSHQPTIVLHTPQPSQSDQTTDPVSSPESNELPPVAVPISLWDNESNITNTNLENITAIVVNKNSTSSRIPQVLAKKRSLTTPISKFRPFKMKFSGSPIASQSSAPAESPWMFNSVPTDHVTEICVGTTEFQPSSLGSAKLNGDQDENKSKRKTPAKQAEFESSCDDNSDLIVSLCEQVNSLKKFTTTQTGNLRGNSTKYYDVLVKRRPFLSNERSRACLESFKIGSDC